ncbi:hypothetical protein D3C71_1682480 [compost metagenome]
MQFLDLQGLSESGEALDLGADIVTGVGLAAVAKAGQVEGDHPVVLGKVAGKTQPVVLARAEAVNHQNGFAVTRAALIVMNAKIADSQALGTELRLLQCDQLHRGQQRWGA